MRFLVDTMYVLWAALEPTSLHKWEHALLSGLENDVLVSAATIFEISQKVRKGKLPEAAQIDADLPVNLSRLGFRLLPLSPEVMHRAARFTSAHADPFDRMIAAQAVHLDIDLLSTDPSLDAFGVRRIKPPSGRSI